MVESTLVMDVVAAASRAGSALHGEQHWQAVAYAGLQLARAVDDCDGEVVLLFALFHDSRRDNEGFDPEHGLRGAGLARSMCGRSFDLGPERLAILTDACARHDKGQISSDPTIGACWDADRLNLWRVGNRPSARLLSTSAARQPALIEEAQEFHERSYDWADLFAQYSALLSLR